MKSGLAIDELSDQIRPQDDLFRHVNGTWLADAVIPPDRAAHGAFHELRDQAERDVHAEDSSESQTTSHRPAAWCTRRAPGSTVSHLHDAPIFTDDRVLAPT